MVRFRLIEREKKRERENTCISESMKERGFHNNIIHRAGKWVGSDSLNSNSLSANLSFIMFSSSKND